ncbi:MAG: hypothetical protein QOG80_2389 [Pseudonocardiales bacterium]|nr:hypothetical protein [Pseudonocardiales bacterium]
MEMSGIEEHSAMDEYEASCLDLYRSELALHDAHQTHVDRWIEAAADRLHQAVLRHEAAAVLVGARGVSA